MNNYYIDFIRCNNNMQSGTDLRCHNLQDLYKNCHCNENLKKKLRGLLRQ
jgi:hypothetical protein